MTRAPTAGNVAFGHDERVAEVVVEANRDVAGELDVLALVVADRHFFGVVQHDVGDHQHRVVEEADAHRFVAALGGLVLELRHAAQLAERRHAVEDPGELGVGAHVALHEQQRAIFLEARRHQHRREATGRLGELGRIPRRGHRVQVDDAEDRVVIPGRLRARLRAGRRPSAGPRRGSCRAAFPRWA